MTKLQMIKTFQIFFLIVIASLPGSSCLAGTIVNTKHNLSASGPGDVRALTEDHICVFCHTPHNATPFSPLWNKKIEPKAYTLYQSSTLSAVPGQPSGPTRLCLSCHDGTIALGEIVNPPSSTPASGIIDMTTERLSPGMKSYLGEDISNDHPVAFSYYDALPNPELADTLPSILHTYGGGDVHCTTCHDPHDDTFGKFLVMDNAYSALCITCHDKKSGWDASDHATSSEPWDPPGEEPQQTVAEYGCESCHIPHGAGGPKRILRFRAEEQNCYSCHNGTVAAKNIEAQFTKTSRHRMDATTIDVTGDYHDPAESVVLLQGHVECVDCHNPHAVNDMAAEPPLASGSLAGVKGILGTTGPPVEVNPLINQYELCFKCHGFSPNTPSVIDRWIVQKDTRLEFDTSNPSYHPVIATGKNSDVPSLFGSSEGLDVDSMISCVDCHDSDDSSAIGGTGPRGPHGSTHKPILRQRYGDDVAYTASSLIESEAVYKLCYRCHNSSELFLDNGGSFRSVVSGNLHTKHVRELMVPCYICHDPHGVQPAGNGDHTHLINFATSVSALVGNPAPYFKDDGKFAGSCTLVCHDRTHDGVTTGTYP